MRIVINSGYSNLIEEQKYANFKNDLAKSSLFPIYDMDKIYVYRVKGNDKLKELKEEFKEKYSENYKIVLSRPQYDIGYYKESLKSFGDLISVDDISDDELYEMFNLNDKSKKDSFVKNNAKYIRKIKDNDLKEEYELETFDEVISRYKKENASFTFRRNSKLSAIAELLINDYFNVEVFANLVYKFIYGKSLPNEMIFSADENIYNKIEMPFSNSEKKIRLSEKFKIVRDIISLLDFELVYSGSITDLPNLQYREDYKVYKCYINRLALDNAKILYSGEFKDTYDRIKNPKVKKF